MKTIFAINTTSTSVTSGSVVPVTTIVRRHGCNMGVQNNGVAVKDRYSEYYDGNAMVIFTAPVAGDVIISVYQNGVPILGAIASETITTASTEVKSVVVPFAFKTTGNCETDIITIVATGVAITASSASIMLW